MLGRELLPLPAETKAEYHAWEAFAVAALRFFEASVLLVNGCETRHVANLVLDGHESILLANEYCPPWWLS